MKQNARKLLSLLLVMALLLVGCGYKEENVSGKVEAAPPVAETQGVVETLPPTEAPTEPENPLSLGRMEGGTYTNTYAGFGCTLDNSWTFYSAEELQSLPADVAAAFEEGSAAAELLADQEQITDMMAENVDLLCTVNVLFQKVSVQERAAILVMGEKNTIETMVEESGQFLKDTYAQMGIEVIDIQSVTRTFLGEERTAMLTTATQEGAMVYMAQILDYTRGSSSVTITFTSYLEDKTQEVMDLFFPID